jgi:glycosyltransferase involved in cell wall biosynthesis
VKILAESLKRHWIRRSDGYFAYTEGVRSELVAAGADFNGIHVLNNTIDTVAERALFDSMRVRRTALRDELGLDDRKVLLFVGRLNAGKRLGFLNASMASLRARHPEYHLVIIGGGDQSWVDRFRSNLGDDGFSYRGVIVDRERIAEWFVRSDAYIFPGAVGLGALNALCYDLTPVVIEGPTHNPEYEYLNGDNAVVVGAGASPADYAEALHAFCADRQEWESRRRGAWPSISHLTIENMARNFVDGVSAILEGARAASGRQDGEAP